MDIKNREELIEVGYKLKLIDLKGFKSSTS